MELVKEIITTNKGDKFEIEVIKWNELKEGFTTLDVLKKAMRSGFVIPTKEQAYDMRPILGRDYANVVVGVWILVAITNDGGNYGASIVSGIIHDNEGASVPDYGKNPNHKWEEKIAFAFLSPVL